LLPELRAQGLSGNNDLRIRTKDKFWGCGAAEAREPAKLEDGGSNPSIPARALGQKIWSKSHSRERGVTASMADFLSVDEGSIPFAPILGMR
jgi:hypothetical protein